MKKKISCILGVMVLAASLAGCGEKKEEQSTTQQVGTETVQGTEDGQVAAEDDQVQEEDTTEETKVEITAPEDGSVRIKGQVYTFSAENGIDNWNEIADGVVISGGISNDYYPADGGEAKKVDYDDYENYPVVFQRSMNNEVNGVTIGSGGFYIYGDYLLSDGVTSTVTGDELMANGYMQVNDSDLYTKYFTQDGWVSYDDIEADYEKIISEDSFKGLDYYDVLGEISSDFVKPSYTMDDVAGAVEDFGEIGDSKKLMLDWLAKGKCIKLLMNGEIDYFICQSITVDADEGASALLVFYVKDDYMNQWMDNWGVKK